ncbi:phage tail domain-containing protein [Streptomyces sp. NPDC058440]|uniref:phage tail domain-containing protein n=1 Tax=Streptomyces sp. NPDC058440 TaxID=3346501 RepID=UPI00364EAE26
MPIPVLRRTQESGTEPQALRPQPPVPEEWQHTYVSITGRNGEGEEIPLTGFQSGAWPSIVIQPGATGLDMPPFEIHADDSPNLDGSIYRGNRAGAREILLPVFIYGIDRKTLKEFKRKLAAALNPRNGYCVLSFTEGDGRPRRLRVFYRGGMEGSEDTGSSGFRWVSYGVQLTALDPWFFGDTDVIPSWDVGTSKPFLGPKFFPLTLGKGDVATSTLTVENPGDIEAWPVWTLTGPLRSFKFTGPDKTSWGIKENVGGPDALATGRTLTVDCRPGYKTLVDDKGKNYFPDLDASPSLWAVPAGESIVKTNLVAGSGTASVSMRLTPRYASY